MVRPIEKTVEPESAGMDAKKVGGVIELFNKQYSSGAFPGGQLVLRRKGKVVVNEAIGVCRGFRSDEPTSAVEASVETLFPFYSSGKPLAAVAITAGAWADCVAWDDADSERQTHQDLSGRLWDVLFMAAYAARANANAGSELLFELYRVPRDGRATESELTKLKLVVGPGDDGEPVMTILLPNED